MTEQGKGTQTIRAGTTAASHDRETPEVDLLSPLTLRGVNFRNRIAMSPMCQYSARNGMANDWHMVHYGSRAAGGASLIIVEATAVTPEGRISPGDLGIWSEEHVAPLSRIAHFVRGQGVVPGIQLAHAGRKGSCDVPQNGGASLKTSEEGGWAVVGPSPIPFQQGDPVPIALDTQGIENVVNAFEAATKRALRAGFGVVEIHAAHGYLLHQFLSPLTNQRADNFGGSPENRMRLPLLVAERVRKTVPDELPVFVRISATDWVDGGWDLDSSIALAREFKKLGIDLIDVSSGGAVPHAKISVGKGYQVAFAKSIKDKASIRTGAVGMITEPEHANEIITSGSANLVLLGRELLREPYWPLKATTSLNGNPWWPAQYGYAVKRRGG